MSNLHFILKGIGLLWCGRKQETMEDLWAVVIWGTWCLRGPLCWTGGHGKDLQRKRITRSVCRESKSELLRGRLRWQKREGKAQHRRHLWAGMRERLVIDWIGKRHESIRLNDRQHGKERAVPPGLGEKRIQHWASCVGLTVKHQSGKIPYSLGKKGARRHMTR